MKDNQGTQIKILTILLIITIVAISIMGYFLFKIYNNKENVNNIQAQNPNNQTSNIEVSKNNLEEKESNPENINEDKQNEDKYAVLELSPIGGIAVLYNGEVYVDIYDSTSNIEDVYGDGEYQTLMKTRKTYKEYTFGNLEVNNNNTKWMKLNIANIKEIHNNEYGQALESNNSKYGIIMVNDNNEISYISIKDLIKGNANITQLSVSNVKNVVTEDNDGYTTYLVYADGKKEDVNKYIK